MYFIPLYGQIIFHCVDEPTFCLRTHMIVNIHTQMVSCSRFLEAMPNAGMKVHVQVLWADVLLSPGHTLRSRISVPYDNATFNL